MKSASAARLTLWRRAVSTKAAIWFKSIAIDFTDIDDRNKSLCKYRAGRYLEFMEAAFTLDVELVEREERERPDPPRRLSYLSTSEIADCTCPEWCERDHDRD
jgi:hypothetical protein